MIILLFGPPGCGKGTQGAFISRLLGIPSISTGEMFRAECAAGTTLGRQAFQILSKGGLIGDEIVNQMVAARLTKPDCRHGFLLDGYPRTIAQARFLETFLAEHGLPQPEVVYLDVPENTLVARITARRQCPACARIYNIRHQPPRREGYCDLDGTELIRRPDDTEDVVRQRLQAYHQSTGPLREYYAGPRLHRIDGGLSVDEIHRAVEQVLEARLALSGAHD
jgi:adenylate kinase